MRERGNVTSYSLLISLLLQLVVIPESDSSVGAVVIAPLWLEKKITFVIVSTKKRHCRHCVISFTRCTFLRMYRWLRFRDVNKLFFFIVIVFTSVR